MATLYTHQSTNVTKTWVLLTTFFVLVIGVGFVFSQAYGNSVILYIAVAISLIMNVGSYWYSDKLVLKMVRAKPVTREEYMELWNIVENLSITAGLPMPKLYIVDDPSPNAFATGRDPEHASIAVTRGLLERLDRSELEGVLAHELGHVKNYDIRFATLVAIFVGFLVILSDMFMRVSFWGGGFRGRDNDRSDNRLGAVLAVVGLVLLIVSPVVAKLIQLAVSRQREYLADSAGSLLTRYPEGLARALEKISSGPPLETAGHATAHLFIANPFKGKSLSTLFATHPPVEDRIRRLRESR